MNRHEAVTKLLIAARTDINSRDRRAATLLLELATNGHEAMVELLIDAGADIDLNDKLGYTALSAAAEHGHLAIIRLLCKRGAEINLNMVEGRHCGLQYSRDTKRRSTCC